MFQVSASPSSTTQASATGLLPGLRPRRSPKHPQMPMTGSRMWSCSRSRHVGSRMLRAHRTPRVAMWLGSVVGTPCWQASCLTMAIPCNTLSPETGNYQMQFTTARRRRMSGLQPSVDLPNLLIDSMASVCGRQSCIYVCGPLTSGRDFYLGPARGDWKSIHAHAVEAENRATMHLFSEKLREKVSVPVIDPGILRVPVWSGQQHGDFFLLVLERFCTEIRLMDGWHSAAERLRNS